MQTFLVTGAGLLNHDPGVAHLPYHLYRFAHRPSAVGISKGALPWLKDRCSRVNPGYISFPVVTDLDLELPVARSAVLRHFPIDFVRGLLRHHAIHRSAVGQNPAQ